MSIEVGDTVEYVGDTTPKWRGRKGRVIKIPGVYVVLVWNDDGTNGLPDLRNLRKVETMKKIDYTKPLCLLKDNGTKPDERQVHYAGVIRPKPGDAPQHLINLTWTDGSWSNTPLSFDEFGMPMNSVNGGAGSALRIQNVPERKSWFRSAPSDGNRPGLASGVENLTEAYRVYPNSPVVELIYEDRVLVDVKLHPAAAKPAVPGC